MRASFFAEYLKNIRSVGAIAPSSPFLARKMLESVNFDTANVIVEYGAGTGAFTAQLVKRMKPGTRLVVIENNQKFYETLHRKYGDIEGVEAINGSAEHIERVVDDVRLSTPDYIISGLPFASLPSQVSRRILKSTVQLLGDKGVFITFQYSLLKRGLLETYFGDIHITRELRNLPPAYVLRCRK